MQEPSDRSLSQQRPVREALAELLAWEGLRRSPQLSAFLSYVVEARLRGDEASIKAYSIAVDVFGRPEDFDPQSDPIVRVQARRLRGLLEDFYQSDLAQAPVRIIMPVGRYVPEFVPHEPAAAAPTPGAGSGEEAASPPRNGRRAIWIAGGLAFLLLLASLYFWPYLEQDTVPVLGRDQPRAPLVIVGEFQNLSRSESELPLAAGLAVEMVSAINRFPDLSARYGGARPQVEPDDLARTEAVYILSGVVRPADGSVRYSVLLHDSNAEEILARYELDVPVEDGQAGMSIREVSNYFVLRLGNPRGLLHDATRNWLDSDAARGVALAPYPCIVAYSMFRNGEAGIEREQVMTCARAGADEGIAELTAILGALIVDAAWRTGENSPQVLEARQTGGELTNAAVAADPLSAFAWTQLGFSAFLRGEIALARDHYNTAMQLNPASVDLVSEYAFIEAHLGNWSNANRLSSIALSVEDEPPDPYFAVPAIWALRSGDYERAITYAERMVEKIPHTGAALLVAAGGYLEDPQIVEAYLPRLLAAPRFKRLGIIPALELTFSDAELLEAMSNGLLKAGVPPDRLYAPF